MGFECSRINNWFFTHRAREWSFPQITRITFGVHRMTTSQKLCSIATWLHIFHAYHTILFQSVLNTFMICLLENAQAAGTSVTMKVVLSSTNSANSTALAVKYFLLITIVIMKFADRAKIASKLNFTFATIMLRFLNCFTFIALDGLNFFTIKLMIFLWIHLILIMHLIMAQSTRKELLALRTLLLASSFVVFASEFQILGLIFLFLLLCML